MGTSVGPDRTNEEKEHASTGLISGRRRTGSRPYREWDYLNSYSLAVSVSEKFSLPSKQKVGTTSDVRTLVSGDWRLFQDRVLFFSPFIPTMAPCQLEFGVIPSGKSLPIHSQGLHAGVHEYLLDPSSLVDDCDPAVWQ